MKIKITQITLACCFFITSLQAVVATGDENAASGDTFSFSIGHAKFEMSSNRHRLWLAATDSSLVNQPQNVKKFGLSYVDEIPAEPLVNQKTKETWIPIASPLANEEDAIIFTYDSDVKKVSASKTTNPIYGASFSFFDIPANKPAFVTTDALTKVYYTQDIQHFNEQTDENKNKTELLVHDFGTGNEVKSLVAVGSGVFAAHAGTTLKISSLLPSKIIIKEEKDKDGNVVKEESLPYLKEIACAEIPDTTSASSVTMHQQPFLGNVYVGLEPSATIKTGVIIAQTGLSTVPLVSIASEDVANDTTVLTNTITSISSMLTSTNLNYLIVADESNNIYALPLVSEPGENYGKVADVTSITNLFNVFPSQRRFNKLLADPDQVKINATYSEQLTVGQDPPKTSASIKDLYVIGDAVYVVIDQNYDGADNNKPGTLCSRAIFADDGHIISWTPWSRVLGSDEPMVFSTLSKTTTAGFYIANEGKKVVQTQWSSTSNLSPFMQKAHNDISGTQGIFNFSCQTPGFNNKISLLIATGLNSVTIGQTGFFDSGDFKIKHLCLSDAVSFNNVNNNSSLIAAELAHDENTDDHWLFAGGASGVAVLADATGVTRSEHFTSVADFKNNELTWKQVGNFSFVKKLVWDNTFLYVLTSTALYRIELDKAKFSSSPTALNPIKLFDTASVNGSYFLDLIVDDGFGIIGTTNGMYSFNGSASSLTNIFVPDGLPAISQLTIVSNKTEPQRNFKEKSNLYVLSNTFTTQQSRLNRFFIATDENNKTTISPLNDALIATATFMNGVATSLIRFNQYVSSYYSNGSWNLASSYFLGITQPETIISPTVQQISTGLRSGQSSTQGIIPHSSRVPTGFLNGVDMLLGIKQESTSGALIMTGNFEARVNA